MLAVGERVDEADGQRFDALARQGAQLLAQVRLVELVHDFALRADALVRFDGQAQRRKWQTLVINDPAPQTAGDEGARDLQHLAVALGRHEPNFGPRHGQYRVGRDGGTVHHVRYHRGVDARIRTHLSYALENALR